jgi:hypothetical protein
MDTRARNWFGVLAFLMTGAVIGVILSPLVSDGKEAIANIILGNVLGWPMMILSYFYGSSSGSKSKTEALLHEPIQAEVVNSSAKPVPTTDLPRPTFGD